MENSQRKKNNTLFEGIYRVDKKLIDECDKRKNIANCRSRNEFIETALRFYIQYLDSGNNKDYLMPVLSAMISNSVKSCEDRLSRNIFKVAVELAKLQNMLATVNDLDEDSLRRLHIRCVDEVRKINGMIDFEDAVKYQNS